MEHTLFIELLREEVCGNKSEIHIDITNEKLRDLYKLSESQDLAHIIAGALQNSLSQSDPDIKAKFEQAQKQAIYRYINLNYATEQICNVLDKYSIPYMPLKGAIIRNYYPSPEMRTSCDIDILVHPSDLDNAVKMIVSELNYTFERRCSHDVSLLSPGKVHLELHFDLIENNDKVSKILDNIWTDAKLDEHSDFRYIMTNEFFVFYHIAHMAEHYIHGGCGVRNFLDLWVAKNKMFYNEATVRQMFAECELTEFADAAIKLSNVWFSDDTHSEITKEMGNYVMGAGIYGTIENKVAISQDFRCGRLRYILNRLFLPYSKMKRFYPYLEKYPILFPFCQIKRWFEFIFSKNKNRVFAELKYNNSIDKEKKKRLKKMIQKLNLKI